MTASTFAPPHRFTVDEYYQMGEVGILAPDARVELLEGQIIDMMPIGPFHSGVINRLVNLFAARSPGRWIVSSQNPVRLSSRSEPQPDFVLLRPRDDFYSKSHPTPPDVILLVEVADSTVRFDREEKLPAYARAGIAEFWIVNLVERVIEVYREPSPVGVYGETFRARDGEQIALGEFPDVVIAVGNLLDSHTA